MPMQEYLQKVQGLIAKHGWAVQGVGGQPPYSYTVGLAEKGFAEVLVMGLGHQTAMSVLNDVARQLISGELVPRENLDFTEVFAGFAARFVKLTATEVSEHMRVALVFSEDVPTAWQLVWPDPQGRFAGEDGVDENFVAMQNLKLAGAIGDSDHRTPGAPR